tara:strand:+ start:137 stop:475 length:339 start_codon:yes stop_codon:yes gene_type:complete
MAGREYKAKLEQAVAFWPTPDASQRGARSSDLVVNQSTVKRRGSEQHRGMDLQTAAKLWPTPVARMHKDNGKSPSELKRNSETLAMVANGSLNPQWVEWLMGYPEGWTDLKD